MLYFGRTYFSEGIDINKTSASKESDICHYWYFLNYSFKFQPNLCNRCHDLLLMSNNLSHIPILNIKGFDYRCLISLISKNEAIKLMQNANLTRQNWKIIKHKSLLSHIKMGKKNLTFEDIEIEKSKFYHHKTSIFLRDVDIEKVLVSNQISFGKKNINTVIRYLYNGNKVKPLKIMVPKRSAYVKSWAN